MKMALAVFWVHRGRMYADGTKLEPLAIVIHPYTPPPPFTHTKHFEEQIDVHASSHLLIKL